MYHAVNVTFHHGNFRLLQTDLASQATRLCTQQTNTSLHAPSILTQHGTQRFDLSGFIRCACALEIQKCVPGDASGLAMNIVISITYWRKLEVWNP